MPGSLFLPNDAYSDISDLSTRSLDSKIGGKKVSFNKAVRIKQYPWKPDLNANTSEHLTLPNSRFWFKVYKDKDSSVNISNDNDQYVKINSWESDGESNNDILSPIAEIDDSDQEMHPSYSSILKSCDRDSSPNRNNRGTWKNFSSTSNPINFYSHSNEPPVDYFGEQSSVLKKISNRAKLAWNDDSGVENGKCSVGHYESSHRKGIYEIMEEEDNDSDFKDIGILKLPRTSLRNESPLRRSVRNLQDPDQSGIRERRSRSHDDYLKNVNMFSMLIKADKSVSTDDLDTNSRCKPNNFFKSSRDMSTQCNGTLTRNKSGQKANNGNLSKDCNSVFERLSRFKSPLSTYNSSEYNKPKTFDMRNGNALNKELKNKFQENNVTKLNNNNDCKENMKNYYPSKRSENGIIRNGIKTHISRTDLYRNTESAKDSKNHIPHKYANNVSEPATISYLRGRQIPLTEVHSKESRRQNGNNFNKNAHSQRSSDNFNISPARNISKQTINEPLTRKNYHEPPKHESLYNRSPSSMKNYSSNKLNGQDVIDWSLSGFQLGNRRENGVVSDSECIVHKRPPLLMYIPGVSHHNRPADDDDRLSALSGMSRSETNDGSSSLFGHSSRETYDVNGLNKRYFVSKDNKSKWSKWKK